MSYCVIHEIPIFLYSARHQEIQEQAFKGRDASQKMASVITRTSDSKEVEEFIVEFLRAQYEKDPVNFRINWATFDITGAAATHEVWDLLTDYCNFSGYGYLSDLRNFAQQLTEGDAGDPRKFPPGQVFSLNHFAKPSKWYSKITHKSAERSISLLIVAKNVLRLVGDMTNFTLYSKDFRISCGANLAIYPVTQEKGQK
jgi:hypothetical protein